MKTLKIAIVLLCAIPAQAVMAAEVKTDSAEYRQCSKFAQSVVRKYEHFVRLGGSIPTEEHTTIAFNSGMDVCLAIAAQQQR